MKDYLNVLFMFAGRKKPVSATPKEMEWAQMACHRCLVYLGDLGKSFAIDKENIYTFLQA